MLSQPLPSQDKELRKLNGVYHEVKVDHVKGHKGRLAENVGDRYFDLANLNCM